MSADSQNPEISIVVTCYNFEEYIEECLQSLFRQVLKPFEIIVTDDASTDRSPQIIERLAKDHPEVRPFLHSQNRGMNENTLFGASKIRGNYCCLIDGDDRFHPLKLMHEWEAMESFPEAAISYSNIATINAEGVRTSSLFRKGPTPPSGFILPRVFSKTIFPQSTSLYRHELMSVEALESIDWIDSSLGIFSDWDMRIRLAERYPVVFTPSVLVEYRLHSGGIHNTAAAIRLQSMEQVFEKNKHMIEAMHPEDRETVNQSLDRLFANLRQQAEPSPPELALHPF